MPALNTSHITNKDVLYAHNWSYNWLSYNRNRSDYGGSVHWPFGGFCLTLVLQLWLCLLTRAGLHRWPFRPLQIQDLAIHTGTLVLETWYRSRGQFAVVLVLVFKVLSSLVLASSWVRLRPRPDHLQRPRTLLFGHYKCRIRVWGYESCTSYSSSCHHHLIHP